MAGKLKTALKMNQLSLLCIINQRSVFKCEAQFVAVYGSRETRNLGAVYRAASFSCFILLRHFGSYLKYA